MDYIVIWTLLPLIVAIGFSAVVKIDMINRKESRIRIVLSKYPQKYVVPHRLIKELYSLGNEMIPKFMYLAFCMTTVLYACVPISFLMALFGAYQNNTVRIIAVFVFVVIPFAIMIFVHICSQIYIKLHEKEMEEINARKQGKQNN